MAALDRATLGTAIDKLVAAKEVSEASTMGEVRTLLATELDVSKDQIKEHKAIIAELVLAAFEDKPAKKVMKPMKENAVEDPRLVKLKELARALKVGPVVYRGLQNMDVDAKIATLQSRLQEKFPFDGMPTAKDIARAKAKRQRDDDLNGIDTSNILSTNKRGRRNNNNKPTEEPVNNDDSEDSDSSSDDSSTASSSDEEEEDKKAPPKARRRVPSINSASASEEEFQF